MKKPRIHNRPELLLFRKQLRNNSTSAEATLWNYLKNRQLEGRKFRRQHSIGKYIVDFYCPSEKLVIELDGEDHFWEDGITNDFKRSEFLESLGLQIIRIENKWVFQDIEYVLHEIRDHFKP
jgi:very-short-patch-repair endonuclease